MTTTPIVTDAEFAKILATGAAFTKERESVVRELERDRVESAWRKMIPAAYRDLTPDDPKELARRSSPVATIDGQEKRAEASVLARFIAEHWHGNVTIQGPTQSGKTSLAVATLRMRFVRDPFDTLFVFATDLVNARLQHPLKHGEAPLVDRALEVGLLVLDDLGQDPLVATSPIKDVIQKRHAHNRPTWVTTGFSLDQLEDMYGANIRARLTTSHGAGALMIRCEAKS